MGDPPSAHGWQGDSVPGPIPELFRADDITVPIQWSLDSALEHEVLRRQCVSDDEIG